MGLFMRGKNNPEYGVIIDIGSGSVLVAIVASDQSKAHPEIIWSLREYAPLRDITSVTQSAKNVMSSLLNSLMALNSEGKRVLQEKTGVTKLNKIQVTVSAPWSYTVTKSISYRLDDEFTVSSELVAELLRTTHTKVEEEIVENEKVENLGLSVVARSIIGISANGYQIRTATNQKAKSLIIYEASAVIQDYLLTALRDIQKKVLPGAKMHSYSFILIYYTIVKNLYPDIQEYCLVDVTYEATEIGIVRNGILTYTTHTPYGSFSLAREISAILDVPLEEAFGYLHEDNLEAVLENCAEAKKAEIEKLFIAYQTRVADLFHETGDSLSVPKKIFLYGDVETEEFFKKQMTLSAKLATSSSHAVYPFSVDLLTKYYTETEKTAFLKQATDTALLISAQFFHTSPLQDKFEQF